jgi:hypothetical protein
LRNRLTPERPREVEIWAEGNGVAAVILMAALADYDWARLQLAASRTAAPFLCPPCTLALVGR